MTESWTISVDGRVYGPYTAEQMQTFQAEGRLAVHSLVARAGEDQFRPASEDPELGALFPAQRHNESQVQTSAPQLQPSLPAAAEPAPPSSGGAPHKFGNAETPATGERNRYVILSDMKSGSITGLEEEIFNLGPAHRFMPQAWILTSDVSLSAIRAGLIQKLGKLDTLFIVDAAHDKAAWFNFGPEADIKVRRMWSRSSDLPRKAG
jgi:GYF domain 2